jgi:hypothetical protein
VLEQEEQAAVAQEAVQAQVPQEPLTQAAAVVEVEVIGVTLQITIKVLVAQEL